MESRRRSTAIWANSLSRNSSASLRSSAVTITGTSYWPLTASQVQGAVASARRGVVHVGRSGTSSGPAPDFGTTAVPSHSGGAPCRSMSPPTPRRTLTRWSGPVSPVTARSDARDLAAARTRASKGPRRFLDGAAPLRQRHPAMRFGLPSKPRSSPYRKSAAQPARSR